MIEPVDVPAAVAHIEEPWSPRTVATVNDYDIRVVKTRGEFVRHRHPETDEVFLVLSGSLTIRFDDGEVTLGPGQLYVVPRGVPHQPVSAGAEVVLIEPSSTVNTGDNPAEERPAPGRARTLPAQGVANRIVRGLLRAPLLCRVVGARLVTLYVVGRRSGRRYAIPVAYTRHDGVLFVGTPFAWGRNLRSGEPIDIRLKGKRRRADVEVLTDEAGVVENYASMARDNRQFARFNRIRLDEAGDPDASDLRSAWAAGARAFRITPR